MSGGILCKGVVLKVHRVINYNSMYIIIGYDINTPLMTMYEIMTLCKHRMIWITCENLVLTITFSPKRSVACWKSCNDVKMAISILGGFSSSHGLPSFQEAHNDILIRMGVDLASGKWKIHI